MRTPADIAIYGGAAGGGKSWALLYEALRYIQESNWRVAIFRKTIKILKKQGGLIDESKDLYNKLPTSKLGGEPDFNNTDRVWKFPSGAQIHFAYLGDESQVEDWKGAQIALAGFDEVTEFSESMFWGIVSRLRSPKTNIKPYVRATCNPDPDSWVKRYVQPFLKDDGYPDDSKTGKVGYILRDHENKVQFAWSVEELQERFPNFFEDDGLLPPEEQVFSFTFIPSSVRDNRELLKNDTTYIRTLKNLPAAKRKQLLEGNWNVRAQEGDYFKSEYFDVLADKDVPDSFDRVIRAWDMAETEPNETNKDPDYTVGLLVGYKKKTKELYILDMVRFRGTPSDNERSLKQTSEADENNWGRVEIHMERPPGLGKTYVYNWEKELEKNVEGHYSTKKKEKRAEHPAIAASQGKIKLRDRPWNQAFLYEVTQFGTDTKKHDDVVDSLSLAYNELVKQESKTTTVHVSGL